MEQQLVGIGEAAEHFGINVSRLRLWCEEDLVLHEKRTNMRYIYVSEYHKIQKIIDFFDSKKGKTRPTLDDVREELLKENLLEDHKESKEVELVEKGVMKAFEGPVGEQLLESFKLVGTELSATKEAFRLQQIEFLSLKQENQELKGLVKDWLAKPLIEDKETKEKLDKVLELLEREHEEKTQMKQELTQIKGTLEVIEAKKKKKFLGIF
jgi:DNA-binding transcriptional MerR regulator